MCYVGRDYTRIAAGLAWCRKRPYASPEAWAQSELDFGVDVWSIGVILMTLILGERLRDRLWVVSHEGDDSEETLHHVDILYPFFICAMVCLILRFWIQR